MRDGRGQVDREEPTGKAGRLHPGQVEMALPLARQKDLLAPLRIKEQTQQKVVVTVKDGDHGAGSVVPPSIRSALASNRLRA